MSDPLLIVDDLRRSLAIGALIAASLLSACGMPLPAPIALGSEHWQEMARTDLAAMRQAIIDGHPGMIDDENPDFHRWVDEGYAQALALVPGVDGYDSMLGAVRWYATGFRDGHLLYSDNIRSDGRVSTLGWRVERRGDRYVVARTLLSGTQPLPPVGATWIGCDGMDAEAFLRERVAPFFDRREHPDSVALRPMAMLFSKPNSYQPKSCRFELAGGSRVDMAVRAREGTWSDLQSLMTGFKSSPRRPNGFTFKDGVLWIQAASFQLQPDDAKKFELLLTELRRTRGAHTLVVDLRGNAGGDSRIGQRLFDAATGGLEFDREGLDRLPQTHALWRVSVHSLAAARDSVERQSQLFGADSQQARAAREFEQQLLGAQDAGRLWLEQPGGPLLTRAEMTRRHARPKEFSGSVILLTDATCASACLDMADIVRSVPGALHVGRTTSADTLYIDIAYVRLPSGNAMTLPLKVWRNRPRANNEALVPDHMLEMDMTDDAQVRTTVLLAVKGKR
jgi:hypothetical protein